MSDEKSPAGIRLTATPPKGDGAEAWRFKKEFFWAAFKALDYNRVAGDYVEFGCHGAMTFRLAFDEISRRGGDRLMWAFDSFAGLPPAAGEADAHPKFTAGTMATDAALFRALCAHHGMADTDYRLVEGFYDETLKSDAAGARPADIALAYIDCDYYSSTRDVLAFLGPRLKPGMIIAFDDYFCWGTDGVSGERRAFMEFQDQRREAFRFHRYRDYGWAGTSYVVEARA